MKNENKEYKECSDITKSLIWTDPRIQEATKMELAEAEIYGKFQSAFGGIYNVIDLAIVDVGKAKKAKDLIGNILMNTRDKSIKYIKETF